MGEAFFEAQERYQLAPLDVHVLLFRAADHSEVAISYLPPDYGWGKYVLGGLDVRVVPGKHTTLLLDENLRDLSAQLKQAIAGAMEPALAGSV